MDGRCKTLDASANGYVRGECSIVFLLAIVSPSMLDTPQSLPSLLILGSCVNQDGRSSSLTAPNGPAQQNVIKAALVAGNTAGGQVGVLEMHGTATALGDPIEVGAATRIFQVRFEMLPTRLLL